MKTYIITVIDERKDGKFNNTVFFNPSHEGYEKVPYIKSDRFVWHFCAVALAAMTLYVLHAWQLI